MQSQYRYINLNTFLCEENKYVELKNYLCRTSFYLFIDEFYLFWWFGLYLVFDSP